MIEKLKNIQASAISLWGNRKKISIFFLVIYFPFFVIASFILFFLAITVGPFAFLFETKEGLDQRNYFKVFTSLFSAVVCSFFFYVTYIDQGIKEFRPNTYWNRKIDSSNNELNQFEFQLDQTKKEYESNEYLWRTGNASRNEYLRKKIDLSNKFLNLQQSIKLHQNKIVEAKNEISKLK